MDNISRRNFMKGVGAVALATATTGLLGGCSDGNVVIEAVGVNEEAEYKGVSITVREVLYALDRSSGMFYVVPKVAIKNNGAAGIPVDVSKGSFDILVNGSERLTLNADTMKELQNLSPLEAKTLNRGGSQTGYLCGKGKNTSTPKYVYIAFYPNPEDNKTCLRCKVLQNQWKLLGSL